MVDNLNATDKNHFLNRGAGAYLVIDTSGSMMGEKLELVKKGVLDFSLSAISKGYHVGLITFNTYVRHVCHLTNNIAALKENIDGISAAGNTNMAPAIKMAHDFLMAKDKRLMVVATDGMPDNIPDTLQESAQAKEDKIDIITVGTDDADYDFLEALASRAELGRKVLREDLPRAISSTIDAFPDVNTSIKIAINASDAAMPDNESEPPSPLDLKKNTNSGKWRNRIKANPRKNNSLWKNVLVALGLRLENPLPEKPAHAAESTHEGPTQKIFFISDTHFDHTGVIRKSHRPFENVETMNNLLIDNWNKTVGESDIVFFLGDLAPGKKARPPDFWLRKLNGEKKIVRSAHDRQVQGSDNAFVFEGCGNKFLLIHDPKKVKDWDGWIIHGNRHTDRRGSAPKNYPFINGVRKTINVNVEMIGFKPLGFDYLCSLDLNSIKRMEKIDSPPELW
jgi:calcineurin-like phosphoesterase family protein/uncharacterized protein YegL